MINKVKEAKKLLSNDISNSKISVLVGLDRKCISNLVELYDEMQKEENKPKWDLVQSEYVTFRKQKYISLSIKIQHKLNDIRLEYHRNKVALKKQMQEIQDLLDRKKDMEDLEDELSWKQKMLNTTSTRLDYVESLYEIQLKDIWIVRVQYFVWGFAFASACIITLKVFFNL